MVLNDDINKGMNKAIAVKYKGKSDYPKSVVSAGSGIHAEKIILEAIENDIPIFRDEELIKQLSGLDFLKDVPVSLYGISADIIEFINEMDSSYLKKV